jgi:hypothetical protein
MMLMRTRLMDPGVWGQTSDQRHSKQRTDDIQKLKAMGFRHVLSPRVLISHRASCASARRSERVRTSLVSAFEDSLQVSTFYFLFCSRLE